MEKLLIQIMDTEVSTIIDIEFYGGEQIGTTTGNFNQDSGSQDEDKVPLQDGPGVQQTATHKGSTLWRRKQIPIQRGGYPQSRSRNANF